ncbi:SDR family NAD(P)-dependent oxidoreductase [Amycolatopsis sp. NPDC004747]
MTDFAGKTYLITGGGSGIGLATAKKLVAGGGAVVLAGRDAERLSLAKKELGADATVLTVAADVSRTADLDALFSAIADRFGVLHGVFANAGIGVSAPGTALTEADFDAVVATNFKGTFFTVQKAVPLLTEGGSIVLNSSWTVHNGLSLATVYAASKAAVLNLARTFAADLAGQGIRVNAVTPGHVETDMFAGITGGNEQVKEFFRSQVVLGRLGQPSDIADSVLFLLSAAAAYITGQELVVDGGLTTSLPG